MKARTIRVPLESYMFLQEECRRQRCGNEHSQEFKERLIREFENHYSEKGKLIMDGSFGGAVGDPKNSYEEGRWTEWNVDDMKKILDEHSLPYEDGEEIDYINVAI